MASKQDNDHHGSTRLHMDMADAVNIMAHGRALWHIFCSDDADSIRENLKQQCASADPINSHKMYLTPKLMEVLEGKGIKLYTFEQIQGNCVFIPAGCAHQVHVFYFCFIFLIEGTNGLGSSGVQHLILRQNSNRLCLSSEPQALHPGSNRLP